MTMSNNDIQDRAEGALLGAWIGDALGLGPQRFLDGLENIDKLREMATELAVQATNV
jgi:ADP-ribosylglycohydrolase